MRRRERALPEQPLEVCCQQAVGRLQREVTATPDFPVKVAAAVLAPQWEEAAEVVAVDAEERVGQEVREEERRSRSLCLKAN